MAAPQKQESRLDAQCYFYNSMTIKKINPFSPNNPVNVGMFAGRIDEVETLEGAMFQTKSEIPQHILVTGERGIGKSSLMLYLMRAAQTAISPYGALNFINCSISISDKTEMVTLIKLIQKSIERELRSTEAIRHFAAQTWDFIQRIKVMDSGVEQAQKDSDAELILDEFAYSLSETCKRICNPEKDERKRDGILVILDEADNAIPDLRLGYFLKSVTESLQKNQCNNVMFVVVGLPEVSEKISASHESALRILSQLPLLPLEDKDRRYVVEKGIEESNKKNVERTSISKEALDQISELSEGYPHFIQQFAYSAFDSNTDGEISLGDVIEGAFKKGGALDQIGARYYASAYNEKIKSDDYRQVLQIMAENLDSWIKKSDIRAAFSGDDSTLSNALTALTSRKIILKNSSRTGEYRLQQKGFALWIKLFGKKTA